MTGVQTCALPISLRELLLKAENESGYVSLLEKQCKQRAGLFTREAEKQGWANLLEDMDL